MMPCNAALLEHFQRVDDVKEENDIPLLLFFSMPELNEII
jgi:hypothetical protein